MEMILIKKSGSNSYSGICSTLKVLIQFFAVSLFLSSTYIAQHNGLTSIIGSVINNETKQPLEYANVFLANTTIGATTGKDGEFLINNVPPGSYDIIFSYLGFETQKRSFQTSNEETLSYYIALKPRPIDLNPVEILGKVPDDWEENLELFTNVFLGETDNVKMTKLLNPEVINFTKMKNSDILKFTADSTLKIENKSLGYRIDVVLESFNYDKSNKSIKFVYYSRFQELTPQSDEEKSRWEDNRRKAYLNSPRYFFHQLVHGELNKNEFLLYKGPFYELRHQKGTQIYPQDLNLTANKDSSNYVLIFTENLKVIKRPFSDTSILTFFNPAIEIDNNGNFLKPFYTVEFYGYWSRQGIADALPKNFIYSKM